MHANALDWLNFKGTIADFSYQVLSYCMLIQTKTEESVHCKELFLFLQLSYRFVDGQRSFIEERCLDQVHHRVKFLEPKEELLRIRKCEYLNICSQ